MFTGTKWNWPLLCCWQPSSEDPLRRWRLCDARARIYAACALQNMFSASFFFFFFDPYSCRDSWQTRLLRGRGWGMSPSCWMNDDSRVSHLYFFFLLTVYNASCCRQVFNHERVGVNIHSLFLCSSARKNLTQLNIPKKVNDRNILFCQDAYLPLNCQIYFCLIWYLYHFFEKYRKKHQSIQEMVFNSSWTDAESWIFMIPSN